MTVVVQVLQGLHESLCVGTAPETWKWHWYKSYGVGEMDKQWSARDMRGEGTSKLWEGDREEMLKILEGKHYAYMNSRGGDG